MSGIPGYRVEQRKWAKFLRGLRRHAHVVRAARDAGLGRATAYRRYRDVPAFAVAWDEAIEAYCEALPKIERPPVIDLPVGRIIGILKRLDPAKYREPKRAVIVHEATMVMRTTVADVAIDPTPAASIAKGLITDQPPDWKGMTPNHALDRKGISQDDTLADRAKPRRKSAKRGKASKTKATAKKARACARPRSATATVGSAPSCNPR